MNAEEWRRKRDDRTLRYPGAGKTIFTGPPVVVTGDRSYLATFAGQVAAITATSLIGRMSTCCLKLDIPDVEVVATLPWAGASLRTLILEQLRAADPYSNFSSGLFDNGDSVVFLGPNGPGRNAHGSGWEAFVGQGNSPVKDRQDANPVGAALAACMAVGELYSTWFSPREESLYVDAFSWSQAPHKSPPLISPDLDLGELWTIGTGSVGTAIAYFLSLATRKYTSRLFDMDIVKVENLDRSPIFTAGDVGRYKALVTREYLQSLGVRRVAAETIALDESPTYRDRASGVPDLLVSAANERNVRSMIESLYPPLQIYGTTGRNWQATLLRHQPFQDPCSCCVFPPDQQFAPSQCATGNIDVPNGDQVDAALPFLSFSAGIMATAEILKVALGHISSTNRINLNFKPTIRLVKISAPFRPNCGCRERNGNIHERMIEGGRYYGIKRKSMESGLCS